MVSAHRGRGSRQTRSTAVEGTPPQRAHPDAGGLDHRRSRRAAPAHIPPSRDVFFDSSRGDEGKERGLLALLYLQFPPLAWPGVPGDQNSSLGRCDRYCAMSFDVKPGQPMWCGLSVVADMAARVRPAWGTGRPGIREAQRLPMRRPDEVYNEIIRSVCTHPYETSPRDESPPNTQPSRWGGAPPGATPPRRAPTC